MSNIKDVNLDEIYYIYDGQPTRKLNRHAKKKSKSGVFWCSCCDAAKVGSSSKCPVCKHVREPGKTKPQNEPIYNDVKVDFLKMK